MHREARLRRRLLLGRSGSLQRLRGEKPVKEFVDVVVLGALLGVGWYLGSNLTALFLGFIEENIKRLFRRRDL
jgi:hypothetical protein